MNKADVVGTFLDMLNKIFILFCFILFILSEIMIFYNFLNSSLGIFFCETPALVLSKSMTERQPGP